MKQLTLLDKLILIALVWFLLGGPTLTGCPGGGHPPPFKVDKLSVLIVEETEDRPKLTSGQLDVLLGTAEGTVRDWIKKQGGEYRLVDVSEAPKLDAVWVQEAFAVERKSLPWMVAATPQRGASVPVTTAAAALEALSPLGKK